MQATKMFDVDKEMAWYKNDREDTQAKKGGARFHNGKAFNKLTMEGEYLKTFRSVKEAAATIKVRPDNLYKCLKGRSKTSGGYRWEYQ